MASPKQIGSGLLVTFCLAFTSCGLESINQRTTETAETKPLSGDVNQTAGGGGTTSNGQTPPPVDRVPLEPAPRFSELGWNGTTMIGTARLAIIPTE